MGKQSVFILFFFLNLLIHNAYACLLYTSDAADD